MGDGWNYKIRSFFDWNDYFLQSNTRVQLKDNDI